MSPDKLRVALLVTVPVNLSKEAARVPEETVRLLAMEPDTIDTVLEPAKISVEPAPEIAELRVPPVSCTEPDVTDTPPWIPEALEIKVPEDRLIAWEIILPS